MKLPKPHWWWVLPLSLLVLSAALPCAAADQTQNSFTITAVIPDSHTLHLYIEGPGSVIVDGIHYTESDSITLAHHSQPEITVDSNPLCQIRLLTIDGVALAQDVNRDSFILDPLTRDITLEAEFYATPAVVTSAVIMTGSGAVIGVALLSTKTAATTVAGQSLLRRILAVLKHRKKP